MKFSIPVFFCLYVLSFTAIGQTTIIKNTILKDYIEFGQGGGFSGAAKSYILTKDGNLYSTQNSFIENSAVDFIKKVKKARTRAIFKFVDNNNINQIHYNEPENMYSFIYICINHKKHSIIWSNTSSTPPQSVTELSKKLNNLL